MPISQKRLKELFPNASTYVLRNAEDRGPAGVRTDGAGTVAVLERDSGDGGVGEVQVQKGSHRHFYVRVTARRVRLLDEDNLCEKYLVDLCRYAGALPSDAPGTAKIEVCQEKVEPGAPEETLVQIFEI